MTVAMSITAIQKNQKKLAMFLVVVTLILAALFMMNKYFEWSHKFEFKLYPGFRSSEKSATGRTSVFWAYIL